MKKYKNYLHYLAARLYKTYVRRRIARIIDWEALPELESGCTAIIGMCSKLPYVLAANLQCLADLKWDDLKAVIIAVDDQPDALPAGFEAEILAQFSQLTIRFIYYTEKQIRVVNQIKDPYVFSWLSWSLCLNHIGTRTALIQDYDALVLDKDILAQRYQTFLESKAKIQGIMWYKSEGFIEDDHLATTFEAFVDVHWLRSFPPVMGYNRVATTSDGRQVNYDTFLDIQHNHTPLAERTIMTMPKETLAHPSQMITQYMRFHYAPGKKQYSSAVIMIPVFHYLSGRIYAFTQAVTALRQGSIENVDLLGNGCLINFSLLKTYSVDFVLKLSIHVFICKNIKPFREFFDYGTLLYHISNTPADQVWCNYFTPEQLSWVQEAKIQ